MDIGTSSSALGSYSFCLSWNSRIPISSRFFRYAGLFGSLSGHIFANFLDVSVGHDIDNPFYTGGNTGASVISRARGTVEETAMTGGFVLMHTTTRYI